MKKFLAILLAAVMLLSVVSFASAEDYSDVTLRIYTNTNNASEVAWIIEHAAAAGFTVAIDDNTMLSGDAAVIQAANERKDGDILFGLNETKWAQVLGGQYENLAIIPWAPTWAGDVGAFFYDGYAYGVTIQNVLMLYRTDDVGTKGEALHFAHWSDMADAGLVYYRQGKVGGTTNGNINNCMLFPYADPASPAGGISVDGWKALWKYCAGGQFTGDSYGFDPLNRGDVQLSTFYSSSLYGNVTIASAASENPLTYDADLNAPGNWALVDIDDGSYFIAEYIGVLDREGRGDRETEAAKAFCEWFGSADTQIAWANEFNRYPCNQVAADECDIDDYAGIYELKNCAQEEIPGAGMKYYEYVAAHSAEWTNIMTNLGFFWKDMTAAPAEPDWANLDWAVLTQKAAE